MPCMYQNVAVLLVFATLYDVAMVLEVLYVGFGCLFNTRLRNKIFPWRAFGRAPLAFVLSSIKADQVARAVYWFLWHPQLNAGSLLQIWGNIHVPLDMCFVDASSLRQSFHM